MKSTFLEVQTPGLLAEFEVTEGDEKGRVGLMPIVGYYEDESSGAEGEPTKTKRTAAVIIKDGRVVRVSELKGWKFLTARWAESLAAPTRAETEEVVGEGLFDTFDRMVDRVFGTVDRVVSKAASSGGTVRKVTATRGPRSG